MNIQAIAKNVRISPRKVRLVADAIRNMGAVDALSVLEATPKQAARPVAKTLKSAMSNATNNAKLNVANLLIGSIQVSEGQVFKRFRPSTRGRIHPYKKRGSTIQIVLTEKVVAQKPVAKVAEKAVKETKKEEKTEKKEEKKG